jgi:hypothetical protein
MSSEIVKKFLCAEYKVKIGAAISRYSGKVTGWMTEESGFVS